MVDSPSIALAFLAGLASFLSPCCLPLVPGYLAAVCGQGPQDRRPTAAAMWNSLLFVGTFSFVFIAFGLSATALGGFLFDNQPLLNKLGGGAMIVMGAFFMATPFVTRLNRQWIVQGLAVRASGSGPVVAGAAFAVAWTPCVGPTLGAILGLAATTSGTADGAGLLAVYSAGLGVPFLLSTLAYERLSRTFAWFARHHREVQVLSGAALVAMGALVFSGELFRLNIEIQQALDGLGLNFWKSI
ncbi:cytochrome c biogenesis CcdA family protein [Paraconexibacter algicola]|uniref:cytochrome c biogenesis CcdA family protein n=1 Tax=Paraconexibacter algicola TaxID=2133960 RepID=UPI001304DC37|nr:cytochrome c biogenesis CcdA family protein [Paraconexibacter algicola]